MAHGQCAPRPWVIVLGIAACTSPSTSGGDGNADASARPRDDGTGRGPTILDGGSDAAEDRARPKQTCEGGKPSYDLDGDGIVDADQNRLTNGNFHADSKGWTASSPATTKATWSGAHETLCIGTSGTLQLSNLRTDGGDVDVHQCVKFAGNAPYGIAARAYAAEDQPSGSKGALTVKWYSDETCTELVSAARDMVLTPSPGSWVSGSRNEKSPVEARSALVILTVSGDETTERRMEFDDVLLH